MANIIQINGYGISSSNAGGGASSFPYTGSAIISGSLIITGSTTSTLGFTGSLFGTSSWARNALSASSFTVPNASISSDGLGNITFDTVRTIISASNSVAIRGNSGISLTGTTNITGTTTIIGNLLPGQPITNNTSSWSLGSPNAAWKDLYVSNGSVYFISGSNTASISFTNGAIDFGATPIIVPTSSIVSTASFAQTASFARTSSFATTASFTQTASFATTASFTQTASFAQNVYAPSFITYSGGSQANSTLNFTDVHSSAGWDNVDVGFYELEMFIVYNAAATSTGARFSLSGSVSQNYLACDVGYSTLTTDRAAFMFRTFDAGTAAASSQLTTGNAAILQGHLNITSTGQLRLRFSSEVNASAITVTDVNGYLRRLY